MYECGYVPYGCLYNSTDLNEISMEYLAYSLDCFREVRENISPNVGDLAPLAPKDSMLFKIGFGLLTKVI
jgi:hypothetical protein